MTVELVSHNLLQFVLISFIFKSWDTDIFEVHRILDLYVHPLSLFIPFIPFQTMRKIEQQMNKAILNREDFRKDNTEVITISDTVRIFVRYRVCFKVTTKKKLFFFTF